MKKHLLAAAIALMSASPASAAFYQITVNGTLVAQGDQSGGTDVNLVIGSNFTLTAQFDGSLLVPWGNTGYSVAGLYGLPTSGDSFFRIDAPGLTWQTSDSENLLPFFYYESNLSDQDHHIQTHEMQPAIIIAGDKVVGIMGYLLPGDGPALNLGSGNIHGWYDEETINGQFMAKSSYSAPYLSDQFTVASAGGAYGNHYVTQGFTGTWDFADSSVVDPPSPSDLLAAAAAVPEPATWAMFLMGFGVMGWSLRLQRRAKTAGPAAPKAWA